MTHASLAVATPARAATAPPRRAITRHTPPVVPALLRSYGSAARDAAEAYLVRPRPAAYLDDLVADYPRRGGKMMRPALCIAAARACGATLDEALPAAAAIELFHNALLIHDDIEDGSEIRRGGPALHVTHGIPLAVNAGDALLLLALQPLFDTAARIGGSAGSAILAATRTMARETVEGQALELGWREANRTDLTPPDYLTMVLKKTAWLAIIWPIQLGIAVAMRGRGAPVHPDGVVRFGFFLGAAFQIQDDLLNLVADAAYGKEWGGDLYEAKRTLLLIHVLDKASATDRATIDRFLALDRAARTPAMAAEIGDLMEAYGAVAYARSVALALAGAAAHEFDAAFGHLPPSPDKDFIAGLIPWVFERT